MKDRELLVPWVEKVLMEILEEDHVHHDDDGDYPIRMDNTIAYVRVGLDPAKNVRVQIFAPLLRDVAASPKLFEKLNQLNLGLAYFRFRWNDGIVEANTELVGEAFRTEEVRVVLCALDAYATQVAGLLEVPKATPWKDVMAEETKGEQKNGTASEPTEDEDDGVAAAGAAGGGVVTRLTPGKRKRRTASAPKRTKERDPDEDPPPGYL
jgi:hypothetical protein